MTRSHPCRLPCGDWSPRVKRRAARLRRELEIVPIHGQSESVFALYPLKLILNLGMLPGRRSPTSPFAESLVMNTRTAVLFPCLSILLTACLSLVAPTVQVQQSCTQDSDCTAANGQISWCHQDHCVSGDRTQNSCRFDRGTPFCWFDQDCDDGRANTVKWCEQGRSVPSHPQRHGYAGALRREPHRSDRPA